MSRLPASHDSIKVAPIFSVPETETRAPLPVVKSERQASDGRQAWIWIGVYLSLAIIIPLCYVSITHQIWEDYFITFRHSRNLVDGKGLVFNPGHRVQGFTSAINVLLPAAFYAMSSADDYLTALNLFRAVSLAMYVLGGLQILRLMLRNRGADRWSPLIFILLYVCECKTVAFTMNGQESAFMVGFLSFSLAAIYRGRHGKWWLMGLCWAGLLYTRPDSPIYIVALSLTSLIFATERRSDVFVGLAKAAALAAAIYLPWFIFAWVYYGQPIPNTVLAKPNFSSGIALNPIALFKTILVNYVTVSGWVFEPIYTGLGGWPRPLLDPYSFLCALICTSYWMIRSRDRLGRMASLMYTLATAYLSLINAGAYAFPWYIPSATLFGTIVLSRAILQIAQRIKWINRNPILITRILQCIFVAFSIWMLIATVIEIRIQQFEIEDNHRKQLGLWLHYNVPPNEMIYLEPIGYIGYFSDRYILDWPGLVAPEVIKLHWERNLNQTTMLAALNPEWAVMRPNELIRSQQLPELKNYNIVKVFDARARLQRYSYIPGKGYLDFDSVLVVLHRTDKLEQR